MSTILQWWFSGPSRRQYLYIKLRPWSCRGIRFTHAMEATLERRGRRIRLEW